MKTLAKNYQLKAEQYCAAARKMHLRMKQIRALREVSTYELSSFSGVGRGSIVKLEVGITTQSGKHYYPRPKTETLCKIAAALNTTPSYLEYGAFSIIDNKLIKLCKLLLTLNVTERNKFIDNAIIELKSP